MFRTAASLTTLVVASLLVTPALAASDHSTVNKGIRIEAGDEVGSVDSVNGSVRIGAKAIADSVETVNGGIKIGESAVIRSVSSVNGSIELDDSVTVERSIETVNGGLRAGKGVEIGDNVETVNGGVRLEGAKVSGNVTTVNGSLRLLDGTEVFGDVVVKKPRGWNMGKRKPVKVEIGADVVVHGSLIFEREVDLKMDGSAKVGEIIGDEINRDDMM